MSIRFKKKIGPAGIAPRRAVVVFDLVVIWPQSVHSVTEVIERSSVKELAPQFTSRMSPSGRDIILRKEVIQPQVPLRLPCYDLVPIAEFILGA